MISKKLSTSELPTVGMGATLNHWSDRTPVTIIQVLHNGRRLVLQADKAIRTDSNGMSESQSYDYETDSDGKIYYATLRKDGRYRLVGSTESITLGDRRKYHDYSF